MPRQARSNPLALAVLVSLYEKPMHPYEVAQTLRTPGQAGERPPQLRLALRRGRDAGEAGPHCGPRDGARRQAPRAHRLRDHRRRIPGDDRLDDRADRGVGKGVPEVHGRSVLFGRPHSRRRAAGPACSGRCARVQDGRHPGRHEGVSRRRSAPPLRPGSRSTRNSSWKPSCTSSTGSSRTSRRGTLRASRGGGPSTPTGRFPRRG